MDTNATSSILKPYTRLGHVYDDLMEDLDYTGWRDFIIDIITERGWAGSSVLDLGCGTGGSLKPFIDAGFTCVGVDGSSDMLKQARAKLPEAELILERFETLDLGKRFDLIVSLFDAINHVPSLEVLSGVFMRVRDHLMPNGWFVFDVNTSAFLNQMAQNGIGTKQMNGTNFSWQSSYVPETKHSTLELSWHNDLESVTEAHVERAYDTEEIVPLLVDVGFSNVETLTFPDRTEAITGVDRVWYFARI